jgi:hypothetical protein
MPVLVGHVLPPAAKGGEELWPISKHRAPLVGPAAYEQGPARLFLWRVARGFSLLALAFIL